MYADSNADDWLGIKLDDSRVEQIKKNIRKSLFACGVYGSNPFAAKQLLKPRKPGQKALCTTDSTSVLKVHFLFQVHIILGSTHGTISPNAHIE